ncbi:MAG: hypothetical protein IKO72_01315 [Kiritimatiellae bacterium]|nr:hypothetical protein [Kiritimatiellia bacterium]
MCNRTSGLISVLVAAVALGISAAAHGETRYRALMSNCGGSFVPGHIMLFDVNSNKWEYVRTVVHPYDGHCRIPMSAAYVNGVVYVVDYCGWNATTESGFLTNPAYVSARILKYDIYGNYLGMLVDSIVDSENKKVNKLDSLVPSPDGQYLYLAQSSQYNSNSKRCGVFRYKISDGNGGCVITGLNAIRGPVTFAKNGTRLYVCARDASTVYFYDIDGDTFTRGATTYYHNQANCAYLDESANRLYVSGYNCGVSAFDLSGDAVTASNRVISTGNYIQVRKVGDWVYASTFDGTCVSRIDPSTLQTATVIADKQYYLYKLPNFYMFNEYAVELPAEIAHYRFDEPANSPVFTNSISSKWPIRAQYLRSGAAGVSGGAVCFTENNACGNIENSSKMLGADYGIFMWLVTSRELKSCYLFSNRMGGQNRGRMNFDIKADGKLGFYNSFFGGDLSFKCDDPMPVITNGVWHHLGLVKNGSSVSLYIDGVKVKTQTYSASLILGTDDSVDFTLGASAEKRSFFVPSGVFIDELRIFEGAPSDVDVAAIYNEHSAAASAMGMPSVPAEPTVDKSIANTYGTSVWHTFPHRLPHSPPSLIARTDGSLALLSGYDDGTPLPTSSLGVQYSLDKGASSWTAKGSSYVYTGTLFENPVDGVLYSFGRTCYDKGTTSYWVQHDNPTNGCDARVGYTVYRLEQTKGRKAYFTNTVNTTYFEQGQTESVDYYHENKLMPGTELLLDGRYYQSYLVEGKVGILSGALTADVGLSDFRPEKVAVVAGRPFAGPVVLNSAGHVATLVPMGTNAAGVATLALASRAAIGDTLAVETAGIELPGADAPFSVRYDARRGQWWAATVVGGTELRLYASRDLTDWTLATSVFTVSNAATTRAATPSIAILENDMYIAFNLACPDGAPAVYSLDDANFTMVRKVAHFRQHSPWPTGTAILFR